MNEYIEVNEFDSLNTFDRLEEYVNEQGYTLGKDEERLQSLLHAIQYCHLHGVITDSQAKQMKEKYRKQFEEALKEINA